MRGTLFVFVSFLVLCSVPVAAQQTISMSLGEFVGRALETNKSLAASRSRIVETRGFARQAGVRPSPELEISGSSGRPFGSSDDDEYSASYSHEIEMAGKRTKRIAVAERATVLASAEADEETRQLTFRISSTYIDAFASQQELDALDRLIAIHGDFLRLVEARVREGDAAPLEQRLLSVDLGQSQARRTLSGVKVEVIE